MVRPSGNQCEMLDAGGKDNPIILLWGVLAIVLLYVAWWISTSSPASLFYSILRSILLRMRTIHR